MGSLGGSDGKESACTMGDGGSIPRSGRSPGEGNSNSLQYSCLENSMDRGAWWATVHGVTKNQTQVSELALSLFPDLSSEQISSNFRFFFQQKKKKKELWSILNFEKRLTENRMLKFTPTENWWRETMKMTHWPFVPLLIWWSEVERTKDNKGN